MALLRVAGHCEAGPQVHHDDGLGSQVVVAERSPACQLGALEQCRPLLGRGQMDSLPAFAHLDQPAAGLGTGRMDRRWHHRLEAALQRLLLRLRPLRSSALNRWRPSSDAFAGVCAAVGDLWIAKRWPSRRVACGASAAALCPGGAWTWTESGCAQLQERLPKTQKRKLRARLRARTRIRSQQPSELVLQRHLQTVRRSHWHSQIGSSTPLSSLANAAPILPELRRGGPLLALPAELRWVVLQEPLALGTGSATATAMTRTKSPRPLPRARSARPAALARALVV